MSGRALVAALLVGLAVLLLLQGRGAGGRLQEVVAGPAPAPGPGLRRALPARLRPAAAPRWVGSPVGVAVLAVVLGSGLLSALAWGPAAGAAAAVVAAAGASGTAARRRAGAAARERAGALEACGALAAELRAGRGPADALEAAAVLARGPLRDRLAASVAVARLGGDPGEVLAGPLPGSAVPEVPAALAACWRVCAGTGAGLAAAVDRLEEGLRAREAVGRAVEAELAGPRATALLLSGLPLVGLVLAAALGARPLDVLLHTPVGAVCLLAGLALDAAGLLWTRRLARSVLL